MDTIPPDAQTWLTPHLLGDATPISLLIRSVDYQPLLAKMADWWPENAKLRLKAEKPSVSLLHEAAWIAGFKVNGR